MPRKPANNKPVEVRKATFTIDRMLHRRLKIAAAEDECEMSDLMMRALKRFLDERDRRRRG